MLMVTDPFAILGLPRRAALDPAEIRDAFQKAAAASHPDAATDDADRAARTLRFQQISEAHATLTPIASRLKTLLALDFPNQPAPRAAVMDEALVALFTQVGSAVQLAAHWTRQRQAATTFLAKANLTTLEMEVQEALHTTGTSLRLAQETLTAALLPADQALLLGEPATPLLHALAQRAAFLEKWQTQLQSAWSALFAAS
jgi:curved DNA-binding protein CbpA